MNIELVHPCPCAERFPGRELAVGVLSPFMVRFSAIVPPFRGYQVCPRWGVSDPHSIEQWGSDIAAPGKRTVGGKDTSAPRYRPRGTAEIGSAKVDKAG